MVGREVRVPRREDPRHAAASRCSRSTTFTCSTTVASRRCAAFRSRSARARSSGIAGVDNNGQTELIDALTGLRRAGRGRIVVGGREYTHATPREMTDEAGLGHIPEDRHARGLVLDFSLAENLALHDYRHEPDSKLGLARSRAG